MHIQAVDLSSNAYPEGNMPFEPLTPLEAERDTKVATASALAILSHTYSIFGLGQEQSVGTIIVGTDHGWRVAEEMPLTGIVPDDTVLAGDRYVNRQPIASIQKPISNEARLLTEIGDVLHSVHLRDNPIQSHSAAAYVRLRRSTQGSMLAHFGVESWRLYDNPEDDLRIREELKFDYISRIAAKMISNKFNAAILEDPFKEEVIWFGRDPAHFVALLQDTLGLRKVAMQEPLDQV